MSNQEMFEMAHESASSDPNPYHTLLKLENMPTESRYVNGSLKFFPPMYIQRYEAVSLILKQLPWNDDIKKVVDFGCAELNFFLHLKYIPSVAEILEVDVNEDVLVRCANRAAPLNADYLFSKRNKPLNVYLLAGSIGDYDDQLQGTDVVVAIEVLEHLNREVLDKVPHNIFHNIKPRIAIFTTPNADFNVLFTNMGRFRHADHKFEWTRMELVKWTQEVVAQYPDYLVKLYEIGVGPEETEHLGCCTQIAVFERRPEFDAEFSEIILKRGINNYKLVREYIYPYYVDQRSNELKIFHEVEYRLKFTFHIHAFFNSEDELFEIPLEVIYPYVNEWCDSEDELRSVLLEHGFYVLERDGMQYLSYRGYISDSDLEDNESMDMNMGDEAGSWDWGDGTDSDAHKDRELIIIGPDENILEIGEPETAPMDSSSTENAPDMNQLASYPDETAPMDSSSTENAPDMNQLASYPDETAPMDSSSNENAPDMNQLASSPDSAMIIDQEPTSMNWSTIPQKEDGEMGSDHDYTDRQ